jgi:hypothetical protein
MENEYVEEEYTIPEEPVPVYPGAPQRNTMATVSLILGVVTWVLALIVGCPSMFLFVGIGLVCFPVLLAGWVATLVTGYAARRQIRASGGQMEGEGYAKAGLIMGWIGVGLTLFILLAMLVIFILALLSPSVGNVFSDIIRELGTPAP